MPVVNQFGPSPALLAAVAKETGLIQGAEERRKRGLQETMALAEFAQGAAQQFMDNRFRDKAFEREVETGDRQFGLQQKQEDRVARNQDRQFELDVLQQERLAENDEFQRKLAEQEIAQSQANIRLKEAASDQKLQIDQQKLKLEQDKFLQKTNPSQFILRKNAEIDDLIQKVQASPILRPAEKQAQIQILEQQRPEGNTRKLTLQEEFESTTFTDPTTGIRYQKTEKGFSPVDGRSAQTIQDQIDAKRKSLTRKGPDGAEIVPSNEEVYRSVQQDMDFAARLTQRQDIIDSNASKGLDPLTPEKKPPTQSQLEEVGAMPEGKAKNDAMRRLNEQRTGEKFRQKSPEQEQREAIRSALSGKNTKSSGRKEVDGIPVFKANEKDEAAKLPPGTQIYVEGPDGKRTLVRIRPQKAPPTQAEIDQANRMRGPRFGGGS